MATFRYKPIQSKSKKLPIYIFFSYGRNNLFRKSIGIYLNSIKEWDKGNQVVKGINDNAGNYNKKLRNYKKLLLDKYEEYISNDITIDNQRLNDIIDEVPTSDFSKRIKQKVNFNSLFEEYIHYCKTKKQTKKGKSIAYNTIRSYTTTFNLMKRFQNQFRVIRLEEINKELYETFDRWLKKKVDLQIGANDEKQDRGNGKKDYDVNYRGVNIKNLKTFFKWVIEDKEIQLPKYKESQWIRHREEVDNIALNIDELRRIFNVDLSEMDPIYNSVRDAWILMALTGTSYIDAKNLTKKNITAIAGVDHMFIKYSRIKTGNKCYVPFSQMLDEVLKKYEFNFPTIPAEAKVNKYIKLIAKKCGLDELMHFEKTVNDKTVMISKRKYKRIHCHTARRTFATTGYNAGMELLNLMQMTGHSTERELLNYIKVTPEDHAKRSAKHEFFTQVLSLTPILKAV